MERTTSFVETASALATGSGSLAFPLATWPGDTHVNLPRAFAYRVRWTSPEGVPLLEESAEPTPSS